MLSLKKIKQNASRLCLWSLPLNGGHMEAHISLLLGAEVEVGLRRL